MRRSFFAGAFAALAFLSAPAPARAQVSLGLRAGYGFGIGKVGGTLAMSEWVQQQIPLQVDALYRVNERLLVGAYFSHAFARTGGALREICDADAECTARVDRLGVQAQYVLAPRARYVPWAGAGIGYEWNRLDATDRGGRTKDTFQGWEYLSLQGGADLRVASRLVVGPFALVSAAEYAEGDLGRGSVPIGAKKFHLWLVAGLRGRFDL